MNEKSRKKDIQREVEELSLLSQINRILDQSMDLRDALHPILKTIAARTGMERGVLTLLDRDTGELSIDVAYGLTEKQKRLGKYKLGEGVIGKVAKTGKPVAVPRISEEPAFLDKTGARRELPRSELSFICVPVKTAREVIGALSVDRPYDPGVNLEEDVRLLEIIASMIAQAVRLRQEAREEKRRLMEENLRLREELEDRFRPSNIIGNSHAMQELYHLIRRIGPSETTVLIRGETGVGKELVAHAIHFSSLRAGGPYVKVNCAALPENLIESELFGHEKGAFTGAVRQRKGRFETARGGTIFLDEIGDLSPAMQVKLLRVLQEKEFERVGASQPIKADARVIAATNRDLEKSIEKGDFRQDLYYRLNVFPVHIPPLRRRRSDILLLTDHFVEKYNKLHGRRVKRISTPAIDMLMAYHWPGNVRELENCIERAVLLSRDDVLHGHLLPPSLQTAEASDTRMKGGLEAAVEGVEREMIVEALKETRGNMSRAAKLLGITERKMGLRAKKYGIDYRRFRAGARRAAPPDLPEEQEERDYHSRW